MDCDVNDSMDFCGDDCARTPIDPASRAGLRTPHDATHGLLKMRVMMHDVEYGRITQDAQEARTRAQKRFSVTADIDGTLAAADDSEVTASGDVESNASEGADHDPPDAGKDRPVCIKCSSPVTRPCWFCIVCKGMFVGSKYNCR